MFYFNFHGLVGFLQNCSRVSRNSVLGRRVQQPTSMSHIRYFSWLRPGVSSRPSTRSGVSAYAARRLAGLPLLSKTIRASLKTKISQSSELVLEASSGLSTSDSGVGILKNDIGYVACCDVNKTGLPVQFQVKDVVGMSNAGGREGRETGCASRVKGVLSIAASRGHLRHVVPLTSLTQHP